MPDVINKEYVVLVNEADAETGLMEKLEAHEKGRLHRAVSVFLFNTKGELLLQKRADGKYHSGGLWTNTCCSHPRKDELPLDAARRRLIEEMGIVANLKPAFTFIYNAPLSNALIEHELDHVFVGLSDEQPAPDIAEVSAWKYMRLEDINKDIAATPGNYTAWFRICMAEYYDKLTA